jgi:branched-chain amino acid transport system substrate-binding protein
LIMHLAGGTRFRRGRRRALGACLAIMVVAPLAACGAGDAETVDSAGLAGTPITIGVLANVSGITGAPEAGAAKVFEAWAADVNATGGIGGHPVQVLTKDTKGDAPTAAAAADELINDETVVAVVALSTSTDHVVGQTLADSGLPVVGGVGYNPVVWGKLKNWFGITTSFPEVVNMQVASAKAVDAKTLSVVACAEDPACESAIPLFEAASKTAGTTFTGTVKVAANAPNFTAECLEVMRRKADFVQMSISPSVGSRVASDCQTQGYTGYFGASATAVMADLYDTPDIRLAGALNTFPWWVDDAPVTHFRDVMKARHVDEKMWAQPAATGAWATGELFKKALSGAVGEPSADVTRETVLTAYGKVSNETVGGLLPQPMTFHAGQPGPAVKCYWLYHFEKGEFSGTLKPSCPQ